MHLKEKKAYYITVLITMKLLNDWRTFLVIPPTFLIAVFLTLHLLLKAQGLNLIWKYHELFCHFEVWSISISQNDNENVKQSISL